MKQRILFLLILTIPLLVFSQRRNRYRYEFIYGVGAANYLGELGGANRVGTNLLKDLEIRATRPAFFGGLRYKNSPYYAFKGTLIIGWIYGSDKLTQEYARNYRNLTFRSPIIEFSGQFEGYFTKEKASHLYRIRNAKGMRKSDIQAYGFVGIGAFFFNPQGLQKGKWSNLQPLGTEGQNVDPAKKKYSRIGVSFPIGLGVKYKINRRVGVGMEIGMRKTLTDYIDDVSTEYYDNNIILAEQGTEAAYFADPSKGGAQQAGQQRGDPSDKDTYMFITFNGNYKFYRKKKTRSKF